MKMLTVVAFVLLARGALMCQSNVVVPATAASVDEGSALQVPGFDRDGRMQILIDAGHLQPLVGQPIFGMRFRRDHGSDHEFGGGVAHMVVSIAPALRSPFAPSARFADNWPADPAARHTVFAGTIVLPDSAAPGGRAVSFDAVADIVRIRFTVPYAYVGGDLCIDLDGQRDAVQYSRYWAVDAAIDEAGGTRTLVGATCGSGGERFPYSSVAPHTLIPGSTALYFGFGPSDAPGALLVGSSLPGIDLGALGLGGQGCELLVAPFATVPVFFGGVHVSPGLGAAHFPLQIPSGTNALATSFRAQFLAISTPLVTTNAIDCTTAGAPATLGMASVYGGTHSRLTVGEGVVHAGRCPAVAFELQ